MGTSQSSAGPTGKSPLVPPWADGASQSQNQTIGPRFKAFRQQLGKAIESGDGSHLRSALGHYARTSTAGASNAGSRLDGAIKAGSALFGLLGSISQPPVGQTIELSKLAGLPCDNAVAALVESLVIMDGDSDKTRSSMNDALIEALDGVEYFDPTIVTEDLLVNVIIDYLSNCIFLMIVGDAGHALDKAKDASDSIRIEESLQELIKVVVDNKMQPKLTEGTHKLECVHTS
jgi:hypothetical protein